MTQHAWDTHTPRHTRTLAQCVEGSSAQPVALYLVPAPSASSFLFSSAPNVCNVSRVPAPLRLE